MALAYVSAAIISGTWWIAEAYSTTSSESRGLSDARQEDLESHYQATVGFAADRGFGTAFFFKAATACCLTGQVFTNASKTLCIWMCLTSFDTASGYFPRR